MSDFLGHEYNFETHERGGREFELFRQIAHAAEDFRPIRQLRRLERRRSDRPTGTARGCLYDYRPLLLGARWHRQAAIDEGWYLPMNLANQTS